MLYLRLLGGLSLEKDSRVVSGPPAQRRRLILLSVLSLAGERGMSRDRLLSLFWPESDTERARGALKQTLYALRRDLDAPDLTIGVADLKLNAAAIMSDAADFEAALAAGTIEQAAGLYNGPVLDGVHVSGLPELERWIERERARLEAKYRTLLRTLAAAANERGDYMSAVEWLTRLASSDPLSATVATDLIRALARAGDTPAALRHAQDYERLVRTELDAAPDPSVAALVRSIRARAASADATVAVNTHASEPPSSLDVSFEDGNGKPRRRVEGSSRDLPITALWTEQTSHPTGRIAGRAAKFGLAVAVVLVALAAFVWRGRNGGDIAFGPVRPLTNDPGLELQPAVSPDGKLVAYVAGMADEFAIYVRPVADGPAVRVANDLPGDQIDPHWSPDGGSLVFVRREKVFTVPALGGTPRMLFDGASDAVPSPDGRQIAYVHADSLLVRGSSGGPGHLLTSGLYQPHSLAWSPDATLISFVSGNNEFLPGHGAVPGNVSPSCLMVIAARGGKPIALSDRRYLHMSPAWLPDGRHLLFMSSRDGGRDIYALNLTDDGHPRGPAKRLTTGLDIGTFSISADASVLAYNSFPNTSNVWSAPIVTDRVVTDVDATPVTSGTQRIEGIAVSRDGQWLAFDSDRRSSNPAIYRMPISGGEPQQVTSGTSMDFEPSFSPDGNEILFQSWRNESRDVYLVQAGGGDETLLAGGPDQEMYADWSPDGRSVVFDRRGISKRELFVVTRDGAGGWGAPRQLTQNGGRLPRWSPDGHWILYGGGSSLQLIPPEGGAPRVLVSADAPGADHIAPGFAIWSPDSRLVFYRKRLQGAESFWSVPVDGGSSKLLARFGPKFSRAHFMFATDGKRLYFTVSDQQSDIKVMQLARRR